MIDLIIFSKDRALQLEGLLSSLKENCKIFNKIVIIYDYSNKEYEEAYTKLMSEHPVLWLFGDISFKERVLFAFGESEYTCFMVDDLIVYRKLQWKKEDASQFIVSEIFSFRLGNNIRHSLFELQPNDVETIHTFDWTKQSKYWGYPLSVDGHVFKTEYIKSIVKGINFDNPNKLEAHFQSFIPQAPKYMSCFNQSVVVSLPINRVSNTATAVYGEFHPHTAKELNDRFLAGERMDWQAMNFEDIKSPHQEVELKFKAK